SITKYCEPFVGGGAVLFDVLSNYELEEVLINDINKDLISAYNQIKMNLTALINELQEIQNCYWDMNIEKQKEFYYEKRERFNF
ncbi:MAG: DNA adenine methylase, partial [Christensenellaceae bacterium]